MAEYVISHFNYWASVILMMVGLYVVFSTGNMVKKLVGLGVFQTSVFLFYISLGRVAGGQPPILPEHHGEEESGHAAAPAAPGAHGEPLAGADHADGASGADAALVGSPEIADASSPRDATVAAPEHVSTPTEPGDTVHFSADALDAVYSNPLPHVLILTAIVVGVATLAVGLALVVRIREAYGSIEDDDVSEAEYDYEVKGADA